MTTKARRHKGTEVRSEVQSAIGNWRSAIGNDTSRSLTVAARIRAPGTSPVTNAVLELAPAAPRRLIPSRVRAYVSALYVSAFCVSAFAQSGDGYNIKKNAINGGGVTFHNGGGYSLGGTVGQHDAGDHAGGGYKLIGGFWSRVTATGGPPPSITWNPNPLAAARATRSLTLSLAAATASGGAGTAALQIKMVDLQHPNPRNVPGAPPPNFTAFDTTVNSLCVGGQYAGHHCDTSADCAGQTNGTCPAGVGCTAAGEANGCVRWVGPVATFREKQDVLSLGTYKAARLQCTPYYTDWTTAGPFAVFGAEILPSSTYEGRTYASDCKGNESTCTNVSPTVPMLTRRSCDVVFSWNPPATNEEPDGSDVIQVLNKFKGLSGAPSNAAALLQSNVPDPNSDVSSLDIVETLNAFQGASYPFSGPCACPSTVVCGAVACPANSCGAGMCVKTCVGGTNAGLPCGDNTHDHCPGGGICPTTGFCRDRCGRCN